jgi:heat shock protein HtpX
VIFWCSKSRQPLLRDNSNDARIPTSTNRTKSWKNQNSNIKAQDQAWDRRRLARLEPALTIVAGPCRKPSPAGAGSRQLRRGKMSANPGLYDHVRRNRRSSVILLMALYIPIYLLLLLFTSGGALDRDPTPAGFIAYLFWLFFCGAFISGIWVWVGYYLQSRRIDRATHARDLSRTEAPDLHNLVEALCISRGQPMPRLQIVETDAMNAYTAGLNVSQYRLAVTRGLLNGLEKPELEAVLAHELAHILNGDVRLMTVANALAGILVFLQTKAHALLLYEIARPLRRGEREKKDVFALTVGVWVIGGFARLSNAIRSSLYKTREFLADAGAVELTKDPDALIRALRKISARYELPGAPTDVMEMCFFNKPTGPKDPTTHPPIDVRIRKLMEIAGGRSDPGPTVPAAPRGASPSSESGPATEEPPSPKDKAGRIELSLDGKIVLKSNISTVVGRHLLERAHPDARYLSDKQFFLQRSPDGSWSISPIAGTTNETMLDGKKLQQQTLLVNGMRISVGNPTKGVERLPLAVHLQ